LRTLLTALTQFSTPVLSGIREEYQDALTAHQTSNFEEVFPLWKLLTKQGFVVAPYNLGEDYVEAYAWRSIAAAQENEKANHCEPKRCDARWNIAAPYLCHLKEERVKLRPRTSRMDEILRARRHRGQR
jgi:hypothetical protein